MRKGWGVTYTDKKVADRVGFLLNHYEMFLSEEMKLALENVIDVAKKKGRLV